MLHRPARGLRLCPGLAGGRCWHICCHRSWDLAAALQAPLLQYTPRRGGLGQLPTTHSHVFPPQPTLLHANLPELPADNAEENKPRNILEEIVWYKAVEINRWR